MPLVTCPDCQSEVSEEAKACPKCGKPMAAARRATADLYASIFMWSVIGFVVGFVVSAMPDLMARADGTFVLSDHIGHYAFMGSIPGVLGGVFGAYLSSRASKARK